MVYRSFELFKGNYDNDLRKLKFCDELFPRANDFVLEKTTELLRKNINYFEPRKWLCTSMRLFLLGIFKKKV